MLNAKMCFGILAIAMASLSGCDPVRTIRHNVVLAVLDEQGVPAANVNVSMKESWESWETWGGGTAESEKAFFRQRWESDFVPWRSGMTDAAGTAVIDMENTALDDTSGANPPAHRDIVSSREYLIKMQGQNVQDEVRLVMRPGASVKGKSYTVTVTDISKPRYIETDSKN